jgi:predicted MFS family arabinose efflux permease
MAAAVLLSAPLYPVSGRWAANKGPKAPFMVSMAVRTATVAGLAVLSIDVGEAGEGVRTLALLLYGLMIVVYPFFEVNTSLIAAKTSPIGPGGGQGFQGGATQLAGIVGGFTAGWLADQAGYDTLAWVATGLGLAGFLLGFLLRIDEKPAELQQPGDDAVARAAVAAMAASTGRGGVPQQLPEGATT